MLSWDVTHTVPPVAELKYRPSLVVSPLLPHRIHKWPLTLPTYTCVVRSTYQAYVVFSSRGGGRQYHIVDGGSWTGGGILNVGPAIGVSMVRVLHPFCRGRPVNESPIQLGGGCCPCRRNWTYLNLHTQSWRREYLPYVGRASEGGREWERRVNCIAGSSHAMSVNHDRYTCRYLYYSQEEHISPSSGQETVD